MRVRIAFFILGLSIAALACVGEDKTERINGQSGWKELDYHDNALVEERSFDAAGGLLLETSFNPDALPVVTKRYVREDGRLAKIEATDASGNSIGSMAYHYDRDGRLLLVSSDGVFGKDAVGMIASSGIPQGSWITYDSKTMILAYDDKGRASLLQVMQDGKVSSVEKRTYGESGTLSSSVIDDKLSGTLTTTTYDEKGRLSERKEVSAKGEETLSRFRYDDDGRLAEERRQTGSHILSIRHEYAADGTQSRVETRRDGMLVLAVDYVENGRVEELYEDGVLFVKATYIGGRKIRDEFYADGVLQRTRDYQ